MTSKDAQQPEKKSETAEERATRLEAELEKVKKETEKVKKEVEKAKKALDEEKKKKEVGGGGQKRKQEEEDAVIAGAPKGPRQPWKKPKRQERPQGNFGAWPPQATAAPFVPAWPAPSFTHSETQEATPMPVPHYLPADYRQQWEMATSFSGQVMVYRRYVEQNMTFYLPPPEGLSQEHVRLWIGGSVEEQRDWGARLEQEQRGWGPGVPSGPPATYGAPGGAYGQLTANFTPPLAPRAPAGRLFPTWPRAQNLPVANQTAPHFGTNQWVSEGYAERQAELQRVRAEKTEKAKKEKAEEEKKEKKEKEEKEKEEKEKAEKKRQTRLEKNKRQYARRKEKKLALKQAKDGGEAKEAKDEEIKEEEIDSLSAPWFETDSNVPS